MSLNRENIIDKTIYGGGFLFDFAKWLIIIGIILVITHYFIITIFIVDGLSMDPFLKTGEVAVLNKISYTISDPERGDVVVVKYPGDPEHKRYVKRVIGLPGEKVTVDSGGVSINGRYLKESYLTPNMPITKTGIWQLGGDEYFLMGDNRPNSNDSRYFGPVEKRFIVGKTSWVIIPRIFSIITPTYVF